MAKSHITIPKTTLMQFSDNGHIYYLDALSNEIRHAFAKTYNTEDDYYPEHIEKFLSSKIESSIGRLKKLVDDFGGNSDKIEFNEKIFSETIKCIAIQLIRIPSFWRIVKSKSIFTAFINAPDIFYSPLHMGDHNYLKAAIEATRKMFVGYEMNLSVIKRGSNCSFILPSSHCINFGSIVFLVLSPYRSLVLLPASKNKKNYTPDGLAYIQINQYSEIEALYVKIIQAERDMARGGRIIGLKEQLERIQNSIAKAREQEAPEDSSSAMEDDESHQFSPM